MQDSYQGKLKMSPREAVEYLVKVGYSKYELGRLLGMKSTGAIYKWLHNPTIKPSVATAYKLYTIFGIVLDNYEDSTTLVKLYERRLNDNTL